MNIAEHKLNLFWQINQLPENLLIELENIVARLNVKTEQPFVSQALNKSETKTENFITLFAGAIPDFPEIDFEGFPEERDLL